MVTSAIKDSWRFLLLVAVMILGYSIAFMALFQSGSIEDEDSNFSSLPRTIETLLYSCIGNFEVDVSPCPLPLLSPKCCAVCVDADVSIFEKLSHSMGYSAVRFLRLYWTDYADQSADCHSDGHVRQSPCKASSRIEKTPTQDRRQLSAFRE